MDQIRYDFAMAPEHTFGIFVPPPPYADTIAAMAGFYDLWEAGTGVTLDGSGNVSAWTGRAGHVLGQGKEAFRPRVAGGRIDFTRGTGAAQAVLAITGGIGTGATDLTLAFALEIDNLTTDSQFVFGDAGVPTFRLRYRPNSGSPILLLDGTNISASTGMPIPAGQNRIPVVVRIAGTTVTLAGTGSGGATLSAPHQMDQFNIGGGGITTPTLIGGISKVAILQSAVTDAERAGILTWLA